ncbi:uncharacterized protein METZ01_LOCUS111163 [marine metagenome]|uniref:Uncharacterized protein n=1 Tax=marine metagenome TaxID=408172 RepID=A0A381X0K0_9ZZZZ
MITTDDFSINIESPLKMDLVTHMTPRGIAESLNLTRWMQPFSEQKTFEVDMAQVVTIASASVGLSQYYKYVLKKVDDADMLPEENVSYEEVRHRIEAADDPSNDEVSDEILDELLDISDTIH